MVVGANYDNCRHGMGLTVNPCILDILGALCEPSFYCPMH